MVLAKELKKLLTYKGKTAASVKRDSLLDEIRAQTDTVGCPPIP